VIAHEAPLTAGFAGEVASTIQVYSACNTFYHSLNIQYACRKNVF
jgi:hypothetical protein